ncbi:hypothetical protein [Endozoicomonas sp. Mp262]|uniref:hypothetical protein n=1 Tax=Endozoicomonas sp. Mp262 TaxID=2919499 RepID=UPI0021D8D20E
MAVLASLITTLGLNSAQFRSELRRSQQQYGNFSRFVKRASTATAGSIKGLTSAAMSMKTALVAVGTGAALYGIKQAYENTAEIKRQADMVGVAAGKWDAYTKAAQQVGVSGDQLSDVFKDLNTRITDAAKNNSGPLVNFFTQINQSAKDWADLAPDEQFKKFSEEINKMTETDARFWLDELNDASTSLLPSLVKNKGELQNLVTEVESLGLALTSAQMEQISQANKDMEGLIVTTGGLWDQIKAAGAPAVSMVSNGIRDWLTEIAKAHGGFQGLARFIAVSLLGAINTTAKAIEAILNKSHNKLREIYKNFGLEFSEDSARLEAQLKSLESQRDSLYDSIYTQETDNQTQFFETAEDQQRLDELDRKIAAIKQQLITPFQFSDSLGDQVNALIDQIDNSSVNAATPVPGVTSNTGGDSRNGTGGTDIINTQGTDWLEQLKQQNMTELELIDAHEQEKLKKAEEYKNKGLLTQKQFSDAKNQIEKQSAKQHSKLLQNGLSSFTGVMGEMMGTQSKAYKVMFAATKAFNIAETMSSAIPAIMKAWSSAPFPYNMPAVATTTVESGALTAAAQAVQLTGIAHSGIDYVPSEGTWLLQKGERVVDDRTNADLKAYLAKHGSKEKQADSKPNWQIIINNAPEGTSASINDADRIITIAVAKSEENLTNQIRRGGAFVNAGRQHLGWQRSPSR